MTFQSIIQDIKSGKISPVYLLHGEEPFFIDQIEDAIEKNVLTESEKAFDQTICYGKDTDVRSLTDLLSKYPMISQRQVVIVREAQELKKIEELAGYIKSPMKSTVLVLAHKYKKVDGRTQFAKLAASSGVVFESKPIPDYQIADWIGNLLRDHKINTTPDVQAVLAEALGNDLTKINNEIEKIKLNIPAGTKLDRNLIDKYIGISKDYSVFELNRFIGLRDMPKVMKTVMYFNASAKKNPITVTIANLFSYFNKIYLLHQVRTASETEQAKVLKLGTLFFLKEYKAAAAKYSAIQCEKVIGMLREYDLRSKGVDNVSTTHEELLKEMCTKIVMV